MRQRKAAENFIGRNGVKRLNCAQAVASAFIEDGIASKEECDELSAFGNGKAPNGCCGSVYAAKRMLENAGEGKLEQFEKEFLIYAKSLICSEIKSKKEIKCFQTVRKSVELVEKILGLK